MTYGVYVIELLAQARPDGRRGPVVYVGQTALTPHARFRQHQMGVGASRIVQRYWRRLKLSLAPHERYETRAQAERAEQRTARRLRRLGYYVYCN
jgi:predicted GIY-YIG superfamily endonuclease